jgi:hypothetical protein
MEDTQRWYQSRTVIASTIVVVATIAGGLGYQVDEETQMRTADLLMKGVAVLGGLIAIWSRVKASKIIK